MPAIANDIENRHTSSEVDYGPRAVVDFAGIILSSMNYSITLVVNCDVWPQACMPGLGSRTIDSGGLISRYM